MTGILKNNLRLFKLDSKTSRVCQSAITVKWSKLGHFVDHLQHKATQTDFSTNCNTTEQIRFWKFHLSNFVISMVTQGSWCEWQFAANFSQIFAFPTPDNSLMTKYLAQNKVSYFNKGPIVCTGVSTPPSKTPPPSFLPSPPLNLQTVQASPPF